jgi:toxin CptA
MSSSSFASTVDLTLRPSMRALQALFWLHLGLIALLPFALQPGPVLWVLLALFGASWFGLRRHPALGFGPKGLVRLVWHAEGHWTLHDGAGRQFEASLKGHSYVHPALSVLNFQLKPGGSRSRVLMGDEAEAEPMRRLRARLGAEKAG